MCVVRKRSRRLHDEQCPARIIIFAHIVFHPVRLRLAACRVNEERVAAVGVDAQRQRLRRPRLVACGRRAQRCRVNALPRLRGAEAEEDGRERREAVHDVDGVEVEGDGPAAIERNGGAGRDANAVAREG